MEHLRSMWRQASKDVVFNSVSDDPWRWDRYSEEWPPRNLTQRTKRVGEITMHLVDYGDDREIYAKIGDRVVGTAYFGYVGADLRAAVQVDPKYRRRGVATAMYVWAEEIARDKLTPDIPHTPYAEALWNQPNRPFGRTAAMKDVAYRGVSLQLDVRRGEPILEALVKRQTNVVARLIIDAMAETVKDRWWAAGAQESDEAGRWWTSKKVEAEIYAMGVTDAWMTLPVVMTASFEGAESTGYNDGTYVWHLQAGHPVTITEFEAMLPDDPQALLDGWRGVTSPGNHDAPNTYWDGTWTKLSIPQMRTTASGTVPMYRGVPAYLDAARKKQYVEACRAGRLRVVADLLIEVLAEQSASKSRWWSFGNDQEPTDEAGRWWISHPFEAWGFAKGGWDDALDDAAAVVVPVVMRAQMDASGPARFGVVHLQPGEPLVIDRFQAAIVRSGDERRLKTIMNDPSSLADLPIPPMRTTAGRH